MKKSSLRSSVILLSLNLLWSFHPLYGKILLAEVDPLQGAWLRYFASGLAWALAWLLLGRGRPNPARSTAVSGVRRRLVVMGLLTFFLTPLLQFEGLARSHASDNAILVSMEPMLAVALAWIFLDERPTFLQIPGFVTACVGVFLISGGGGLNEGGLLVGNLMIVGSMLGEASYSILGKALVGRVDPLRGFGLAMGTGAAALGIFAAMQGRSLLPGTHGAVFWFALMAVGPLGTTGGYLAWWYLLRDVPVRLAALSLFIQPVAGALWGSVFLQDPWSTSRAVGALLVVAGVLAVIQSELNKTPKEGAHAAP